MSRATPPTSLLTLTAPPAAPTRAPREGFRKELESASSSIAPSAKADKQRPSHSEDNEVADTSVDPAEATNNATDGVQGQEDAEAAIVDPADPADPADDDTNDGGEAALVVARETFANDEVVELTEQPEGAATQSDIDQPAAALPLDGGLADAVEATGDEALGAESLAPTPHDSLEGKPSEGTEVEAEGDAAEATEPSPDAQLSTTEPVASTSEAGTEPAAAVVPARAEPADGPANNSQSADTGPIALEAESTSTEQQSGQGADEHTAEEQAGKPATPPPVASPPATSEAPAPPPAATPASTGAEASVVAPTTAGPTDRSVEPPPRTPEPSQPPAIDPARFVSRVARAFEVAQQRGGGPIEIRLSPPELGAVQLKIEVSDGVLTAQLETETQAARNALIDNLPALRERLAEQDMRVEKFDVDVRDENRQPELPERRDDSADRDRAESRSENHRGQPADTSDAADAGGPTAPHTIRFSDDGINLVA